jgi:hypothetical protein
MVVGAVDRVTLEDGEVKIHIGEHAATLQNIGEIFPDDYDPQQAFESAVAETE